MQDDRVLASGMRLVVQPVATEVTACSIAWRNGFRAERPGQAGYAHLCEHLLFEGSAGYPAGTHHESVNRLGGVSTAQTRCDYTVFTAYCRPDQLAALLRLEADRFARPLFLASAVREQLAVVTNEIREKTGANPPVIADWNTVPSCLFEDFAHSHDGYGTVGDLGRVSAESLREFYLDNYTWSEAAVAVVGPHQPAEVFEFLPPEFSHQSPAPPCRQPPAMVRPRRIGYSGPRDAAAWVLPEPAGDRGDLAAWVMLSCLLDEELHSLEEQSSVGFGIFDDLFELDAPRYLSVSWPSDAIALGVPAVLACLDRIANGVALDPLDSRRGRRLLLDELRSGCDPRVLSARLATRALLAQPAESRVLSDSIRDPDYDAVRRAAGFLSRAPLATLYGAGSQPW